MKKYLCIICGLFCIFQSTADSTQRLNLAPDPSFEHEAIDAWFPVGLAEDVQSALSVTEEQTHQGEKSLKIHVCPEEITSGTEFYSSYNAGEGKRFLRNKRGVYGARTIAYRLDRDVKTFQASVWVHCNNAQNISLQVRWHNRFGRRRPLELIHTSESSQIIQQEDSWQQFYIEAVKPHNAHQAQLAVITQDKTPFYIDDIHIDLIREEGSQILINQVGYETGSRSKFALFQQSNQSQLPPREFQVVCLDSQQVVFEGTWESMGYHPSFDCSYWRADFNALDTPGQYVIQTRIRDSRFFSDPFFIGGSLLMEHAAQSACDFFYYQRCGMEIPGFHAACHMDDSVLPDGTHRDLSGGWHDAGDYNKYNGYTPESFYALILTYDRKKEFYDQFDRDNDGISDLLDEAIWGAKFMLKCIEKETMRLIGQVSTGYRYWGIPEDETDNKPGTGDERPVNDWNGSPAFLPASFALLSMHVSHPKEYLDTAEKLYEKRGGSMTDALALYAATQKEQYKQDACKRASEMLKSSDGGVSNFRDLAEFAIAFPGHELVSAIKEIAPERLRQLQEQCDSFFGVHRRGGRNGEWIYFSDYQKINDWYVGESRECLDHAYEGLLLEQLGLEEGRTLAGNQLHWILGRNPFNVSMMEGVGRRFIPQYHHRYNTLPAAPNGAVPGAVVNGITRSWPWTDRPWLDMNPVPTGEYQCNEPWLPHNNRMLFVLSLW